MADYSHNDIFLLADGFDGNEDKMHINGGILGTGGNGYDDNDSSLVDDSVVNRPWVEDKLVHCCSRCSVKFNFFSRKHHCRCCGNIFCDPCASERRIISAISRWQAQRVCIDCAARLDAIAESTDAEGSTRVEAETATSATGGGKREGPVSYNHTRDNTYMGVDANNTSLSSLSLAPPPPMSAVKGNRDKARESWDMEAGDNRSDSDDWGIDLEALRKGSTTGAGH